LSSSCGGSKLGQISSVIDAILVSLGFERNVRCPSADLAVADECLVWWDRFRMLGLINPFLVCTSFTIITGVVHMKLRVGFDVTYSCPQATPTLLMLNTHPSLSDQVVVADRIVLVPSVPLTQYYDVFGNLCSRIVTPADGSLSVSAQGILNVASTPETYPIDGRQHAIEELPAESLQFLLGSRYCETDLLSDVAWKLFGEIAPGRDRVRAICDYAHTHIKFDYKKAHANGVRSLPRRRGCLPRLRPTGNCALPGPQHSGALLHRLYQRCQPSAALRPAGLLRMVRSVSRRILADLRPAQQRTAHRPRPHGARARCDGRRNQHDLWASGPG
jgi:hypothetical protein